MSQHPALRIIHAEHQALAGVLNALLAHLAESHRQGTLPDFALLRAMVFYVDEFPQKRHHQKETELLFPKLRARTPLLRSQLDRLDDDHAHGERHIRELEHALLAYEMMGEPRRKHLERLAQRHVDLYLSHMRIEEREILPVAERVLTPEDWAELNQAFMSNRDPLTGHDPEDSYHALFARIAQALPPGALVPSPALPHTSTTSG